MRLRVWWFLPRTNEGRTTDAFRVKAARGIDEVEAQAEMVAIFFLFLNLNELIEVCVTHSYKFCSFCFVGLCGD